MESQLKQGTANLNYYASSSLPSLQTNPQRNASHAIQFIDWNNEKWTRYNRKLWT